MTPDDTDKEQTQQNDPDDPEANGHPQPAEPPTLNDARPGTANPGMTLVTIASFGNSWEAHLAAGKLEAAGIPVVLADENINSIGGGLYGNMVGGIKLQVPQLEVDRALEALPQRVRIKQVKCPRCGSADTRLIDFSPGLKICFLLLLGIPYLFVQRPWVCLTCSNVWRAIAGQREEQEADDDDDQDDDDDSKPE